MTSVRGTFGSDLRLQSPGKLRCCSCKELPQIPLAERDIKTHELVWSESSHKPQCSITLECEGCSNASALFCPFQQLLQQTPGKNSEEKVNSDAEKTQNNITKGSNDQKLITVTLQPVGPKNKGPVAERQRAAGLN